MYKVKFNPFSYTGMKVKLNRDFISFFPQKTLKAGTILTVEKTINQAGKFLHSVKSDESSLPVCINVDYLDIL